jgi:glycosyltransferase involved in cell wall biosynthesis
MANKPEISVIIPAYNEGDVVEEFLNDLISQLELLGRTWEVIFLDNDAHGNSQRTAEKFTSRYPNFHGYQIAHPGTAIADKSNKYMLGFELAKGRYIFHMDADGQDRPEELPKFIEKLDEGYDLVVGYKKKRQDNILYMLPSRGLNFLVRFITGVPVHDMNNGFKGYKAEAAKSLKLYGGDFRFIPVLLSTEGRKIVEVPVAHRKREHGDGKFNFMSRLRGGVIDLVIVIIMSRIKFIADHFRSKARSSYKQLILKEY